MQTLALRLVSMRTARSSPACSPSAASTLVLLSVRPLNGMLCDVHIGERAVCLTDM